MSIGGSSGTHIRARYAAPDYDNTSRLHVPAAPSVIAGDDLLSSDSVSVSSGANRQPVDMWTAMSTGSSVATPDVFGTLGTPTRFVKHLSAPASLGADLPLQLEAMSRRMTEPGAIASIMNTMDISARTRLGQGLGKQWNTYDRQAIPEENRVFPERIRVGADGRTTVMIKDVPVSAF